MLTEYQQEQLDTLVPLQAHIAALSEDEQDRLLEMARDYLAFRHKTARFLKSYFGDYCTAACYQNQLSACCSKDGIITFFADMALNLLLSPPARARQMGQALNRPHTGFKCVYLSREGCLWHLKPLVCEMFLCDPAQKEVFAAHPRARTEWLALKKEEKRFRWPDQPVLFDQLESYFIRAGLRSSLMYLHCSPGLLRIKQRAGLAVEAIRL